MASTSSAACSGADLTAVHRDDDAAGASGSEPDRRRFRRVLLIAIPAIVVALVFGGGVLVGTRVADPAPATTTAAREPEPAETVTVTAPPETEPPVAPVPPASPTRLIVPSLDVKADVVRIELSPDAVLEPPADPDIVGWWNGSAEPGDTAGRVVLTGHTVSSGGGALDLLPELDEGKVVLVTETGRHRYRVTDNLVVSYEDVAENAVAIFGQSEESPDGARLILVTCTDFNGEFYESNSIVVAEPV